MEQKSIILELEEAKQELVQCVNEIMSKHNLPCYLIEPSFAELYRQIQMSARQEVEQAKQQHMAAMRKEEEK